MKQRFFDYPKENFIADTQICIMGCDHLFCTCGYEEKLVYKGKDYCFECGAVAIDIEESLVAGHLHAEDFNSYQQSFYQLSIEHDYEINKSDVFIEHRYQLNFSHSTYIFTMKKFTNEELVLTEEKSFFNQKYTDFTKLFDSGIIPFIDLKNSIIESNDEEPTDEFMLILGEEFPPFAHKWLYYVFDKITSKFQKDKSC